MVETLKFEDVDDFKEWFEDNLRRSKEDPQFQEAQEAMWRLDLENGVWAKFYAAWDMRVGTCDICDGNLGYLMDGESCLSDPPLFKPLLDKKTKLPIPDPGNNPWPIIDDEDSQCCKECNITQVLPARFAMSDKASQH